MPLRVIVPLHISGLWIPHYSDNPLESGSVGAGLAVASYLTAREVSECSIILNGESVLVDQARETCRELGVNAGVVAYSKFNLGSGFGLSAALLISHSIVSHIARRRPLFKALQRAHVLEVKYRTGLGDVIAEYTGGFVIRVKPGAPGVGVAYRVPVKERVHIVLAETGRGEPTSSMLSRLTSDVLSEGERLLSRVVESENLAVFFESARLFTSRLFNYSAVEEAVKGLRGVVDYYLKKSALVIWTEREYVFENIFELEKRGFIATYTTISPIGVHVVDTARTP